MDGDWQQYVSHSHFGHFGRERAGRPLDRVAADTRANKHGPTTPAPTSTGPASTGPTSTGPAITTSAPATPPSTATPSVTPSATTGSPTATGTASPSASPTDTPSSAALFTLGWYPADSASFDAGIIDALPVKPQVVNYYSGWDEPFNASFAQAAYADGIQTFVEMEPWNCYSCDGDSVPAMTDIAAGGYDGYLTGFGQAIKAFGHPVLVTFAHEMNGGWYPWGYYGSEGTTPEQWIAAWDHVVTVVNAQAPGLVTWVWAANVELGATSVAQYWPGAQYVGEVGLDGYLSSDSDTYQSEFGQTVTDVRALTDRPIWITETGVNQDDSAGQRLADLAAAVKQAGLTGMLYFDQGPAALSTEEEQLLAGVIGPWVTSSPIPPVLCRRPRCSRRRPRPRRRRPPRQRPPVADDSIPVPVPRRVIGAADRRGRTAAPGRAPPRVHGGVGQSPASVLISQEPQPARGPATVPPAGGGGGGEGERTVSSPGAD